MVILLPRSRRGGQRRASALLVVEPGQHPLAVGGVAAGRLRREHRPLGPAVEGYARAEGARCLWLETSNVNEPAIQFYRREGFVLCGLDQSLYDPTSDAGGETALYFARPIT